ncbi:MAG: hypothetical protein HYZ49_19050 [Chloroflexi bacterium]|nr:hypothetical protein [Chloroflexota bacterium]
MRKMAWVMVGGLLVAMVLMALTVAAMSALAAALQAAAFLASQILTGVMVGLAFVAGGAVGYAIAIARFNALTLSRKSVTRPLATVVPPTAQLSSPTQLQIVEVADELDVSLFADWGWK